MDDAYRVPITAADRIRAGLAMHFLAVPTGISVDDMHGRERLGPAMTRARRLAMYLAHVGFGWPLERVAHAFGVNRATAASGCRWAEDAREDPTVDALLDRLEATVREVCDAPRLDLRSDIRS